DDKYGTEFKEGWNNTLTQEHIEVMVDVFGQLFEEDGCDLYGGNAYYVMHQIFDRSETCICDCLDKFEDDRGILKYCNELNKKKALKATRQMMKTLEKERRKEEVITGTEQVYKKTGRRRRHDLEERVEYLFKEGLNPFQTYRKLIEEGITQTTAHNYVFIYRDEKKERAYLKKSRKRAKKNYPAVKKWMKEKRDAKKRSVIVSDGIRYDPKNDIIEINPSLLESFEKNAQSYFDLVDAEKMLFGHVNKKYVRKIMEYTSEIGEKLFGQKAVEIEGLETEHIKVTKEPIKRKLKEKIRQRRFELIKEGKLGRTDIHRQLGKEFGRSLENVYLQLKEYKPDLDPLKKRTESEKAKPGEYGFLRNEPHKFLIENDKQGAIKLLSEKYPKIPKRTIRYYVDKCLKEGSELIPSKEMKLLSPPEEVNLLMPSSETEFIEGWDKSWTQEHIEVMIDIFGQLSEGKGLYNFNSGNVYDTLKNISGKSVPMLYKLFNEFEGSDGKLKYYRELNREKWKGDLRKRMKVVAKNVWEERRKEQEEDLPESNKVGSLRKISNEKKYVKVQKEKAKRYRRKKKQEDMEPLVIQDGMRFNFKNDKIEVNPSL
ncbi:MAG: hypothetical protein KAT37_04855, partial [Candidatus Aenigmarchaeota archaeon]|nr:hypothetical protein [Candidatus Aenigmarchaeota archaeon]